MSVSAEGMCTWKVLANCAARSGTILAPSFIGRTHAVTITETFRCDRKPGDLIDAHRLPAVFVLPAALMTVLLAPLLTVLLEVPAQPGAVDLPVDVFRQHL